VKERNTSTILPTDASRNEVKSRRFAGLG